MGTAIRRVMMNDPMVRMRVLSPTVSTSGGTGRAVRIEVPKLPVSIPASQDRYCIVQDRGMPMASRTPALTSAVDSCPSRRTLRGSPGDAKRMVKTTKLTPRSRSIVMVSSLDSTRAMGRIAEDFMVDDYLVHKNDSTVFQRGRSMNQSQPCKRSYALFSN